MSIVTVAQLKAYSHKADADTSGEALYQIFIGSSETIVNDYIGYVPTLATYTETYYGDGKTYLDLTAPVRSIASILVNGEAKTVSDFVINKCRITEKNGNPFNVGDTIAIIYAGGYATIPDAYILTVLRIATLLTMEAGENVGVTSQTFDGGNTRTFISYTNFTKYLSLVASMRNGRIRRLEL